MSTKIKFKQIAFPSNNKAFIKGDGTFDTNNYLILDDNDKIPEENIPDSVILKAIYYEDFINADYTPKLGETIIIIDYIKVDNKNIPSFVIGDGTTTLKNLSPSGDFTKWKETIDYSQSAEPTLNTSKEDTLKGHLSYLAKAVKWIKGQFSKYLPLAGGTMSGAINMNKFSLKNAGFEVVTALPTTNLFVGRKVVMKGVEYTYNGNLWTSQLDPLQKYNNNWDGINTPLTTLNAKSYELQLDNNTISQIPQLLANISKSLINHILQSNEYIYERMDNGSTEWVETTNRMLYIGDKLRFTAWKDWETNVRGLSLKTPGSVNSIGISINKRSYKMKVTIEYLTYTNTLGDADVNNSANYTWWKVYEKEFPEQETTWIFPLHRTIYPNSIEGGPNGYAYIHNVRVTIESITAGTSSHSNFIPSINIFTSNQINPQNVPININYDAKIKPTQTTTTYKTNSWILQYLTQGVHWLRDNKVETNTDAAIKKLTLSDNLVLSNGTTAPPKIVFQRDTTTDDYYDYFIKALSSGGVQLGYNTQGTGVDHQMALFDYNGGITATKLIKSGGTSSQFLKADGSVDSNSYATLNEEGYVEKSILTKKLEHTLTVGNYKFDGSTDVTIPIYDNEYTIN